MGKNQKKNRENVFPWWKRYGETIRETRERFLLFHPTLREKPIRYEGRLDPLAEGIILFVLPHSGEERLRHLEKEYEVEILLGFRTDSIDILGFVEEVSFSPLSRELIHSSQEKAKELLDGCRQFPIPLYSSPYIKGLRKNEYQEKIVIKEMCFTDITLKPSSFIRRKDFFSFLEKWIPSIPGDFRQQKILHRWKQVESLLPEEIQIIHFSLHTNSGAYVRTFISEFTKQSEIPATSLRIRRNAIGEWGRKHCPFE